jgi:hypothetical protein
MSELFIVTGASSNHFACLKNLLFSLSTFEADTSVVVYDLGLQSEELGELKRDHRCDVRRFPYENYPPHVNLAIHRRSCAWKPIIIADLLAETGGSVLWLDAGNLVHQRLDQTRKLLAEYGLCSPRSTGFITKWTHAGTLQYLDAGPDLLNLGNRNAAIVGFAPEHKGIKALAERWKACALDADCITPAGATWQNHRFDQAVLSVLIAQFQKKHRCVLPDRLPEISAHNDHLSLEEVRKKLRLD